MRKNAWRCAAALVGLVLTAAPAAACPACQQRPLVWAGVFDENFLSILGQIGLATGVLLAIALSFQWVDRRRFATSAVPAAAARVAGGVGGVGGVGGAGQRRGPLLSAGIMLGIGMGGFLDGIFLHMLLQWHNLIAQRVPPSDFVTLEINMFWDGIFNLGMWFIVAIGLGLLWRAIQLPGVVLSGQRLLGSLLAGWGIFQIVDSIFFHWIFHLHHIKQGSPNSLGWDLAYFLMGVVLTAVGWLVVRAHDLHRLSHPSS